MIDVPTLQSMESSLGGKDAEHPVAFSVATVRKLLRMAQRSIDLEIQVDELERKVSSLRNEKYNYFEESKALSAYLTSLTLSIKCIECSSVITGRHGDTCPHCESMLDVFFGVHENGDK